MVLLNDLLYLVQPHVRGCPEPLMKDALVRAARRFASETRLLRETLVLDIVEGQSYYALTPASDQEEVTAIKAAAGGSGELGGASLLGGGPLEPRSPEEVPPGTGCPFAFWFEPTKEVVIIWTPNFSKEDGLAVRIVRQPKRTAVSIAEDLVNQDNDEQALAAGALAELLLMPGAWKDVQMAGVHEKRYDDMQRVARHRADTQYRPWGFRTRPAADAFNR